MIGRSLLRSLSAASCIAASIFIACVTLVCGAAETSELPSTPACFVSTGDKTSGAPAGASVMVTLEVADTVDARATGLMHRKHLDANAGMLFVFPGQRTGDTGFWMYNTLIPLDIAFLDNDGYIGRILNMVPCPHQRPARCPSYRPEVSYRQAVEMNAGFFGRHRLREGDRLLIGAACHSEPRL